ncbi:MAG: dihydropteroate synthase [Myxococcales bacterium]|nr:dihydropteroate synthase [Myxococcales bacterium]
MELGPHRIEWTRPVLLGVLNVTQDSFSDGGSFVNEPTAVAHGLALIEQGADIIDVGGESTRPGAEPVPASIEIERIVPVIRALVREGALVSVDTTKPAVAEAAFSVGARVLNDVGVGADIAELAPIVARYDASYLRMHARGTPRTMRSDPALTRYEPDVVTAVRDALARDVGRIESSGVHRSRIWVDPGIGFAKTARQSIALLAGTDTIASIGCAVCVGPSRKSFIADPDAYPAWPWRVEPTHERLAGTCAAVTAAILAGAHAVRVHDVREVAQAARVAHAIKMARGSAP